MADDPAVGHILKRKGFSEAGAPAGKRAVLGEGFKGGGGLGGGYASTYGEDLVSRTKAEVTAIYDAYNTLQKASSAANGDGEQLLPAFQTLLEAASGGPLAPAGSEICSVSGGRGGSEVPRGLAAQKLDADGRRDAMLAIGMMAAACEQAKASLHLVVQGLQFLLRQLPDDRAPASTVDLASLEAARAALLTALMRSPQAVLSTLLGLSAGKAAPVYVRQTLGFLHFLTEPPDTSSGEQKEADMEICQENGQPVDCDTAADMGAVTGEGVGGGSGGAESPPGVAVLAASHAANCWLRITLSALKRDSGQMPREIIAVLERLVSLTPEPSAEELEAHGPYRAYAVIDGRWLAAHAEPLADASKAAGSLLSQSWGVAPTPNGVVHSVATRPMTLAPPGFLAEGQAGMLARQGGRDGPGCQVLLAAFTKMV
eukprot:CAMPEP_0117694306 /NCGR_PEP_ID=MMETSP0804-20121206/27376_1 /TAXON_ID=1074897 /ORGANISM="Tetraselmis astigmatica, Strain CCMP880" /LENGTH=427 /DNA_ID=CAMNT_0005507983 /DNA_START=82 /DNA_END=1366 /DNA_ORIENTATION=-